MNMRCDKETSEWMREHPFVQTTVVQCEKCGLFYKASLGHKCITDKYPNRDSDADLYIDPRFYE